MSLQFTPPATPFDDEEGGIIAFKDLHKHICLFEVKSETEEHETKFGDRTAIEATVTVLDSSPVEVVEGRIYPKGLVNALRPSIGGMVLARVTQGANKKGNPPWLLEDLSQDPAAVAMATAHIGQRSGAPAVSAATPAPAAPLGDTPPF